MKNPPLISVIIPVYNGERYLAEAIESVLAQTYHPMEILVIDDGSTDGTAGVADHFSPDIKHFYQTNGGTGAARNRGIEEANGGFFAFLDADDIWVEDKLMRQMAEFHSDPSVDIVYGHVQQFYSPELDESARQGIHLHSEIMPAHLPSAMLVKRESFLKVGFFETNWQVGQDVSWFMRVLEQDLNVVMLPEVVYKRRIHSMNKGITQREFMSDRLKQIKASLDRRRKLGTLQPKKTGDIR